MVAVSKGFERFAETQGEVPVPVDARRYLQEEPPAIEPVIPEILDMPTNRS